MALAQRPQSLLAWLAFRCGGHEHWVQQLHAHVKVLAGTARITDGALGTLIGEYCREAGVRKLKQQLEKIYRKVALRLVKRGASAKVRTCIPRVGRPQCCLGSC